ncbi:MAG: hypothetical protein JETT_1853 [Candidatus Jettenia ecosi]|uniref:Uncharacterized protein n=1 Tax=Candidatus Jettenia ecosi TaxID=2494326 RepID=A0A533QB68_9BACT|nr:MAG: hypothetical protein JETT_1853 [Candidatus Jettenia ecosi]
MLGSREVETKNDWKALWLWEVFYFPRFSTFSKVERLREVVFLPKLQEFI